MKKIGNAISIQCGQGRPGLLVTGAVLQMDILWHLTSTTGSVPQKASAGVSGAGILLLVAIACWLLWHRESDTFIEIKHSMPQG